MLRTNLVRNEDCVAGLKTLAAGSVDLAFADPPFNIGYDYDVYDDRRDREEYLDWSRDWTAEVVRVLEARRHLLAGHRRRIRRRTESHAPAGAQASLPELGRVVLHLRRELQKQVQPLARPPVPHGEGPEEFHLQRRRDPRPLGAAVGLRRPPGEPAGPAAGRYLDPPSAGLARGLPAGRGHLVFPAGVRHVQGAGRLARLPDAGATAGPDHPRVQPTRANWCWIRLPAAARRWPWPRSSGGNSWVSSCRRSMRPRSRSVWRASRPATVWTGPKNRWSAPGDRRRPSRSSTSNPGRSACVLPACRASSSGQWL